MALNLAAGSSQGEVQKYIYELLSADYTLNEVLKCRTYDAVPENAEYPYAVIGDMTETNRPTTHSSIGRAVTLTVHIWSRYQGSKEVQAIGNRIIEIAEPLNAVQLGTWTLEVCWMDMSELGMRDPDGITRHGVVRLRIHTRAQF